MSALPRRLAAAVLAATTAAGLTMPVASAAGGPSWRESHSQAPRLSQTASSTLATTTATTTAKASADSAGPHSPLRRTIAKPKVTRVKGAVIADVDFGDVELVRRKGQFRAPMRGVLVVPDRGRRAPLVVMSHLRMPGCTANTLAYPCPKGTKELRLDRGMTYLGEDLARRGYAVLIPDLAPLWIGDETSGPYDQLAGWQKIVGGLRDRVAAANRGRGGFGLTLTGRIDTGRSALVVHSRSAYIVGPAVRAWRRTSPVASIFAYGPAATADDPAPPDVPYLVTLGSSDDDVATTPADWVAAHLGARRRSMLALATVPGLGHSYVNRTLSAAGLDDRKDCDTACPTARAHEVFLTKAVNEWLAATYPRQRGMAPQVGTLPLRPQNPLPASVGGRRVQWLAVTHSQHVRVAYDGVSRTRGVRTIGGGSMKACRYYEAMDPTQARDRCPDTELGVVNSLSRVLQVRLTPTGGVDLLTRPRARGPRGRPDPQPERLAARPQARHVAAGHRAHLLRRSSGHRPVPPVRGAARPPQRRPGRRLHPDDGAHPDYRRQGPCLRCRRRRADRPRLHRPHRPAPRRARHRLTRHATFAHRARRAPSRRRATRWREVRGLHRSLPDGNEPMHPIVEPSVRNFAESRIDTPESTPQG